MSKTPISMLQEIMVQKKIGLPNYIIESCSDMPGASFKCLVKVDKLCVYGYGANKKDAKHNSAKKALELMGFTNDVQQRMSSHAVNNSTTPTSLQSQKSMPFFNYVGKLNEFASTNRKMYPVYIDDTLTVDGRFVSYCTFLGFKTEGYGLKKKDSKQDAARRMLERLRTEDVSHMSDAMSSLHIEKLEKIDNLSKEVLRKYEDISGLTENQGSGTINYFKPIPNLKDKVTSLGELKSELEKYGYTYSIEVFQKAPYIMMMKLLGSNGTIMGIGNTKDEAIIDLFETALHMFSQGFTLDVTFLSM